MGIPPSNASWHPDQGTQQVMIDKNGVARRTSLNLGAKADDASRYQREKRGEQLAQGGFQNVQGGSTALSGSPSSAVPAAPPPASVPAQGQEWLIGLQQAYASGIPMRMDPGDPMSSVITAELLNPTATQLNSMSPDAREAVGRAFLAIATKIFGDNTLTNAFLTGTKIQGYVPGMIVQHFKFITGRR